MPNRRHERKSDRIEAFKLGKIAPSPMRERFTRFASWASYKAGSPFAFAIALGIVLVWAVFGPAMGWSPEHMLIINTVTTIGTWLMVFIIQNTQNRETKAMNLKLDELLRAVPRARKEFMEAEEEDLEEIIREKEFVDAADPAPPTHKEQAHRNGGDRKAS